MVGGAVSEQRGGVSNVLWTAEEEPLGVVTVQGSQHLQLLRVRDPFSDGGER